MQVKDLIEILGNLPEDATVTIWEPYHDEPKELDFDDVRYSKGNHLIELWSQ